VSALRDRRLAWFAIDVAVTAGFVLDVAGDGGELNACPPEDLADDIRDPIERALFDHRAEVVGYLRFLDSEARRGRHWVPGARGTAQ
jgi:hypothetical protein